MNRLLFISNIADKISMFSKGAIQAAHMNDLKFYMAANWSNTTDDIIQSEEKQYDVKIYNVSINRFPLSLKNIQAYKQIREIIQKSNIDFIHCNTPVGGVIGRLLHNKVKKVIYEAHGFHFYKGAPFVNWILYYPIEKLFARWTDAIITINKDDYQFAKKHLHPKSKTYYVPGVGIELDNWKEYRPIRKEIQLGLDDFVILVVGRLEQNKNCITVIEALSKISDERVKLVFCGDGKDREFLMKRIYEMGLENRVIMLGNRTDMSNIYHMSNCFVLASFREGLSRSIMEAMACGLPCIVSDIRGNRDLIDNEGGFRFNPLDSNDLANKIRLLRESEKKQKEMKIHNLQKITSFSIDTIADELSNIYEEVYGESKA